MGRIAEETIEQIVAATDIVDLISSYFPLKKAGTSFKANCPFHNEKTPSFNVSPQKQAYYCFGCGAGGGAINFVKEYENLPFLDAVKKLAQRAGIPIIEDVYDPEADKRRQMRSRLLELHGKAADFFLKLLLRSPEAAHARAYLKQRGLTAEIAKRWKLGWIPDTPGAFLAWAKSEGYSGRDLVNSGIAALKVEDNPRAGIYLRFRDRLMFPVHNDYGDVVAFSGRVLQSGLPTGKYLNSPETVLFNKSKTMFALDRARRPMMKAKKALVCEGQLDVISCVEHGIDYAVAPLGTAFTEQHANLLKRYTSEVVLCFDSDPAGKKAVERAYRELVPVGLSVKVVSMPEGEDPDSLLQSEGVEAFQRRIDEASDFFDFKITNAKAEMDLSDPGQRSELSRQIADLIAPMTDPVAVDTLVQGLSAVLKVGTDSLRQFIAESRREQSRGRRNAYSSPDDDSPQRIIPVSLEPRCAALCKVALENQQAQQYLYEQIESFQDFLSFLPQLRLLFHILAKRPSPDSPSEIQAYLSAIPAEETAALQALLHQPMAAEPLATVREIQQKLGAESVRFQIDQLKAQLQDESSPEKVGELMSEISELQGLLREIEA